VLYQKAMMEKKALRSLISWSSRFKGRSNC